MARLVWIAKGVLIQLRAEPIDDAVGVKIGAGPDKVATALVVHVFCVLASQTLLVDWLAQCHSQACKQTFAQQRTRHAVVFVGFLQLFDGQVFKIDSRV